MIYSFYVENFLSIRDRQEISFATTSDKTVRDFVAVEVKPNVYINKLAIFYGSNASGKSNMLYAMEALFFLLCFPQFDKTKLVARYMPFALTSDKPTSMGIIFYKDGIQYDYEITYCKTHIISEKLRYYPKRGGADFYSREFVGEGKQPKIEFGGTLKMYSKTRTSIIENTFNNHTVLSTIAKMSLKDDAYMITELYDWVKTKVHNVDGDTDGVPMTLLEEFVITMLLRNFTSSFLIRQILILLTLPLWITRMICQHKSLSIYELQAFQMRRNLIC